MRATAEVSGLTGFAGNRLWRDGERRNGGTLAAALEHPEARIFLTCDGEWLCRVTEAAAPDPGFAKRRAVEFGAALDDCVLLGFDPDGRPSLAAAIADTSAVADEIALIGLRSIAMQGFLDPDVEGQLGQAAHLLAWHAKNRFCARCGTPTRAEAAGYRRRCEGCDDVVFPRTDPVTIMLVHDGGRCVLGRQPHFPENFWSCLAGFVEPGETVEAAVRRETLEEAGLTVGTVRYFASQPWPFPGSLMIGCLADATSYGIDFDAEELEACRWFTREEVRAMLAGRHPDGLSVPQPFAIAHHLIKAFAEDAV